jgi:hypothetical protein
MSEVEIETSTRKKHDEKYRQTHAEKLRAYHKDYYQKNKLSRYIIKQSINPLHMQQFIETQINSFNLISFPKLSQTLQSETNVNTLQAFKYSLEMQLYAYALYGKSKPGSVIDEYLTYYRQLIEYTGQLIAYLENKPK